MNRLLKTLGCLVLAAALTLPGAASATLVELMIVIAVKDSAGRTVQTVTTDRKGGFKLSLPAGSYQLVVKGDSLAKTLGPEKSVVGPGKPPMITVVVSQSPPEARTVLFEQAAVVRVGRVNIQDISMTKLLVVPTNGIGGTGGGRYTYTGGVTVAAGDFNGDGR